MTAFDFNKNFCYNNNIRNDKKLKEKNELWEDMMKITLAEV